jgi:[protein-PII] uridylyltransferase
VLLDRSDLLTATDLHGSDFTTAYTERLDEWVSAIAHSIGVPDGVALIAVGGFGRRDVAPESDLDIVLVHTTAADFADFADKIWYPIWDAGIKLGHRVDTVEGLLKIARTDLDTATSLLDVRPLAGDEALALELAIAGAEQWRDDAAENVARLADRIESLHSQHGEVAFGLGPDLKNGRGGLRDVQALEWARATGVLADIREDVSLADAYEVLLRARVELHRLTGRPGDRLVLDFQDDVAAALNYRNADVMMAELASAARTIAWVSDAAWFWVERSLEPHRRLTDTERRADGITIDAGLLSLSSDAATDDPLLLFETAYVAATHRCFIERRTLERLAASITELPDPWTAEMRNRFSDLLRLGRPAISVIEAFDQVGLMSTMIPEWEPCRSKPQRNSYHRFTVDRHLLEAAAEASLLSSRVDRSDLLVVGALLHDIGKGYKGDHTEVGVELVDTIAVRMGFDEHDAATLVAMCQHHLLLPDVATRRDLDDDGTITYVANEVESVELLELLGALTEADSIATGPSAWNGSKAELVRTLVDRVRNVLRGVAPAEVVGEKFPGPVERKMIHRAVAEQHGFLVDISATTITVVQSDRPGAFSRVAGVLTLNGLDIVSAAAQTEAGTALSQFIVHHDEFDIGRLEQQLLLGTSGRLALESRVAERRHTYARAFKRTSAKPIPPVVTFDNRTSELATVVEVRCRDQIGVLYRISRAMSEMGIGISTARIQTIGDEIIDAFYVTSAGGKVLDSGHLAEIERAILHAIEKS